MDTVIDTRSGPAGLTGVAPWMTAQRFARWPGDGTGRRYQLIDGEPVAMVHPSQLHAFIQSELGALIRNHLRATGDPGRVLTGAGVRPPVGATTNVRVPDLVITRGTLAEHFVPEPVVLVEILSPFNEAETREAVRACLAIPSLREVVVVSSVRVAAEVARRDTAGAWPDEPEAMGEGDTLSISAIGFRCALRDLYPAD